MALMGTPVVKLTATGPHEYLQDTTQEYSVVLNTQGLVLLKRTGYREPFRTIKRLSADEFKEIGTDKDKATAFLQELFKHPKLEGYALVIPEVKDLPQFESLKEKIAWEKAQRKANYVHYGEILTKAHLAGMDAAGACVPEPMFVVQHANPLDDNSPIVKAYEPVLGGVCGFAWVHVRPANSQFANYLKKEHSDNWRYSDYDRAMTLWVRNFGQSMERKEAYARAYADVLSQDEMLKSANVTAYAGSRMD